jgi:predicted hydrocarbon binding protein
MLERISDVLPRYSTYGTLFRPHAPLQKALEAVYLQILKFIAQAMKMLTKSSGRTIAKAAWKSFGEDFQGSILQLRRYRELVEDEAKLASMIEQMREKEQAEAERRRAAESRKKIERLETIVTDQEKCRKFPSTTGTP